MDLVLEEKGHIDEVNFGMCEEDIEWIMKQPYVMAGSDGKAVSLNCPGRPHPRFFGTFPRIIGHSCRERIIEAFKELGLVGTQFNRAYYDDVRESKGIQNYFVPKEMGTLLEKMYRRTLINPTASDELERILLQQQINHKMGGKLPLGFLIAHKTGEEEDKTHDVGIVYGKEPFVACYASYESDLPTFEDFIRRTTYELAAEIDPGLTPMEGVYGYY